LFKLTHYRHSPQQPSSSEPRGIGRLSQAVGAKIDHVQLETQVEAMENAEATEKRK